MKIVIATGVYPPDIGGPAIYAKELSESLEKNGHIVSVSTFSGKRFLPTGIRHIVLFIELLFKCIGCDALIAFDTFSVALPSAWVSRITATPLVVRVGGDFLWEHYVNRTGDLVPLPDFYKKKITLSRKERIIKTQTEKVLEGADTVVFTNMWMNNIYAPPYGISSDRAVIIENAIEKKLKPSPPHEKNFLFYTRDIPLKNGDNLRRAFQEAKKINPNIVLEEGRVSHKELLSRMENCYAVVLPSVSEVSPNYILDALRCSKPFILTKYSGYAESYGHYGLLVDPLDVRDIKENVLRLAQDDVYEEYRSRAEEFSKTHTYDDIAREYVDVIKGLIHKK